MTNRGDGELRRGGYEAVAEDELLYVFLIAFRRRAGEVERHRVRFTFDQTWGSVEITVDGRSVVSDLRLLSLSTTKRYQFVVGMQERHEVVIEKRRPLLLAGFRPQTARVFVDGRHLGDFTN